MVNAMNLKMNFLADPVEHARDAAPWAASRATA
jgi:hypothetical protein